MGKMKTNFESKIEVTTKKKYSYVHRFYFGHILFGTCVRMRNTYQNYNKKETIHIHRTRLFGYGKWHVCVLH